MLRWRWLASWVVCATAAAGCGARTPIDGRGAGRELGGSKGVTGSGAGAGGADACAAVDADLDGHEAPPCGEDCDDADASVHPGALDAATGDEPWSFETVDVEGHAGLVSSIAVDRAGRPHVSYSCAPKWPDAPQEVRYARRLESGWAIETVVEGDAAPFFYTSLALDADELPHVAFCSLEIQYAARSGSGSGFDVAQVGTSPGGAASHCSLALDQRGTAHVAYHGNNTINYATNASGAFETEQIGEEFFTGTWADLALDDRGAAFVVYGFTGVWLATRMPGRDWHIEVIDATPSGYTSLALGPDGHPNVAYVAQAAGDELRFARWTGDAWKLETVDAPAEELGYASIAVDAEGVAHVAYENFGAPPGGQLRYARREPDGQWSLEIPDPGTPNGSWTSIAVGAHGVVHLSYLYAGPEEAYDLRWARRMVADGIDQDCDGTDG